MIEIEWLWDEQDCELCGWTCSKGAIVKLNGEAIIRLEPVAHCYNGVDYSEEFVYKKILDYLGYEIKEYNDA